MISRRKLFAVLSGAAAAVCGAKPALAEDFVVAWSSEPTLLVAWTAQQELFLMFRNNPIEFRFPPLRGHEHDIIVSRA